MDYYKKVRLFAIYVVALYLFSFLLELKVVSYRGSLNRYIAFDIEHTGGVLVGLAIAPSVLYILCSIAFLWLAIDPRLIKDKTYSRITAYALAPLVTAWISGIMFLTDPLNTMIASTLVKTLYLLAYSVAYVVFALLVYKVYDPLIGDADIAEVNNKIYRFSTIMAAIVGLVFIGGFFVGLIARLQTVLLMIYPGIGLLLVAFYPAVRRKPYRFLLAFPLLGQAVTIRTFFIDIPASYPLFVLADKALGEGLVAWSLLVRGLLFPIPGFGGAQASLATMNFLQYLNTGSTIPMLSAPITFSAIWIFLEWLLFYNGLKKFLDSK